MVNLEKPRQMTAVFHFRNRGRVRPLYFDFLFLSLAVWLSLILYTHGLGFYLDDWNILAVFTNSGDSSPFTLFRSVYSAQPWARMRPVQLFNLSWLYWLFGLNPLGYHITNAVILNLTVLLFYLTLRELNQSRLLTLAVPL